MPAECWRYGDAWERYPIEPGEVWQAGAGRVAVGNLFDGLPPFMRTHDLVFVDPPWNLGNLNSFYTKAGRIDYADEFGRFLDALFAGLGAIAPITCYIEMGRQHADEVAERLERSWCWSGGVQRWNVTYYRKHPCVLMRASIDGPSPLDYTGIDEARCIQLAVKAEERCASVADPCMGRGLVGLAAFRAGRPFAGTDINKRRLACLLDAIARQGGKVRRLDG